MPLPAHIAIFLIYASATMTVAFGLPELTGTVAPETAWTAAALIFVTGALAHEVIARRMERLDLFEELYDLRIVQQRAQGELTTMRDKLNRLYGTEKRGELVTEIRMVRSLLTRLELKAREAAPDPAVAIERPPPLALEASIDERQIIDIVRDALKHNRIDLYLQPIVSLPQRKIRYFECLSRIRDGDGSVIAPETYLAIAEQAGLISTIDNFLLFRCVQLVRRTKPQDRDIAYFCNLSPHTLEDEVFFAQFIEYLEGNLELADSLIFEFVEADLSVQDPALADKLRQLADLGFRLSADGVTSLMVDYPGLAERDVQFIKIDAETVLDRAQRGAGVPDVDTLRLAMARAGIRLIVGMIEDEQTVVDLLEFGIDLAQGYLFGTPQPAA